MNHWAITSKSSDRLTVLQPAFFNSPAIRLKIATALAWPSYHRSRRQHQGGFGRNDTKLDRNAGTKRFSNQNLAEAVSVVDDPDRDPGLY